MNLKNSCIRHLRNYVAVKMHSEHINIHGIHFNFDRISSFRVRHISFNLFLEKESGDKVFSFLRSFHFAKQIVSWCCLQFVVSRLVATRWCFRVWCMTFGCLRDSLCLAVRVLHSMYWIQEMNEVGKFSSFFCCCFAS